MIHDEEFDLVWADPPPSWVENVGPLMEYWGNPIFQRRYVIRRLRPAFGVMNSFLIGIGISLVLNVIILLAVEKESRLELGLAVSIVLPAIVALGFMSVRFFGSCLLGTPLELRRELFSGMLGAVLATPQSDRRVFFAECVSGLMSGMGAMEETAAMLAGLVISYAALQLPALWEYVPDYGITLFWWLVLIILVFVIFGMLAVLTAFAAGLYSVLMPLALTIPATVGHVVISFLGSLFVLFQVTFIVLDYRHANPDDLIVLLIIATLEIGFLAMMTMLTSQWGVMAFARARRPGYYEPEHSTAGGLLRREYPSEVTFGRSV